MFNMYTIQLKKKTQIIRKPGVAKKVTINAAQNRLKAKNESRSREHCKRAMEPGTGVHFHNLSSWEGETGGLSGQPELLVGSRPA